MKDGDVLLLENLRFHAEEEKNDKDFSQSLARLADIYVDDAFAVAHRGHASNAGITAFVKTCAVGLLLQSELDYLKKATENPVPGPSSPSSAGPRSPTRSASSTGSWKRWISSSSGAAWPSPFSRPSGTKSGSRSVRRTCSIRPGRSWRRQKHGASSSTSPWTAWWRKGVGRRRDKVRARAGDPKGMDGPRHRTRIDYPFRRGRGRCEDHSLERPHGHVRARSLQQRNVWPRLFRCVFPRPHHRGRRRHRHGRAQGWRGTQDFLHIHRRGRVPRACSKGRPCRRWRPSRPAEDKL